MRRQPPWNTPAARPNAIGSTAAATAPLTVHCGRSRTTDSSTTHAPASTPHAAPTTGSNRKEVLRLLKRYIAREIFPEIRRVLTHPGSLHKTLDIGHQRSRQTVIGLYKAELVVRHGPWRNLEHLELSTPEWVDWHNQRRLHSWHTNRFPERYTLDQGGRGFQHSQASVDPGTLLRFDICQIPSSPGQLTAAPRPRGSRSTVDQRCPQVRALRIFVPQVEGNAAQGDGCVDGHRRVR